MHKDHKGITHTLQHEQPLLRFLPAALSEYVKGITERQCDAADTDRLTCFTCYRIPDGSCSFALRGRTVIRAIGEFHGKRRYDVAEFDDGSVGRCLLFFRVTVRGQPRDLACALMYKETALVAKGFGLQYQFDSLCCKRVQIAMDMDGKPVVNIIPVQRILKIVQLVPNLAVTRAVPAGDVQYTDGSPLRYDWTGQASADILKGHFKPLGGTKVRLQPVGRGIVPKKGRGKAAVKGGVKTFFKRPRVIPNQLLPLGNRLPLPTASGQYRYKRVGNNGRPIALSPNEEPQEWFVNMWQEC